MTPRKTTMNSRFSLQQFKVLLFVQGLSALFLAAPCVVSAATIDIKDTNYPMPSGAYFVSPNGKDTNSGKNPNSPWPVAKALNSAPSRATIVFRGGTYRNINDLGIGKRLTLQPYPHEKVWIKGSDQVEGWVADGSTWRKDRWTHSFPQNLSKEYIDPKYPMAGYRDMVYINGVSLKQVARKAEVVSGTFYVDSNNHKLYIGDNPAGKNVEATARKQAFSMWKSGGSDPSNTVIRGLGFAHFADQAIGVAAPRVTLENNTIVWNGLQGVQLWGHCGWISGISADAIVIGNTFSYNGLKGLGGELAHRMLLENNTISYNNVERFAKIWDAAGIKVIHTDGVIWRNNLVENNFATGMWLDVSSTNATVVNNISRYNEAIGIFYEISHKAIIASNVVYNNGTGIMLSDVTNVRVYNNTLSMNNKNIQVKDSPRVNDNQDEIAAGITWITRNNVLKNNIFSNTTSGPLFEASGCDTSDKSTLMISALDDNAYYRKSSTTPQSLIRWSFGRTCSVGYNSVADFRSATNLESDAVAVDNVPTNPFFIDEANQNYRLKSNSPAIGRGEPLPADIATAIGVESGTPVNLGALKFTSIQ